MLLFFSRAHLAPTQEGLEPLGYFLAGAAKGVAFGFQLQAWFSPFIMCRYTYTPKKIYFSLSMAVISDKPSIRLPIFSSPNPCLTRS